MQFSIIFSVFYPNTLTYLKTITDECALNQCFFRGYCEEESSRCICDSGFSGTRCEREIWSQPTNWTDPLLFFTTALIPEQD